MPSYPSSVKTFTTKVTGETLEASHINEPQDEIVAIESGLLTGLQHHLTPSPSGTRDLGSSSLRWRDLWLSGSLQSGSVSGALLVNGSVTDAKLRDSAATSVIGRAGGTGGPPADITAAADAHVLRRVSGALGFGTLPTGSLDDNAVTDAKLRDSAATSVIGRSSSSAGDPADIVATTDNHVLRRVSGTLGFGTLATGSLDDNAVTNAKLRDSVALSVIGRATNTAGDPADITADTDGHVLRRAGTALGFGTVGTAGVALGAITNDRLRDSAALSVIGRASNSSGPPADIAASGDGEVLRRSGTALGFGTVATAGIADGAVTPAKASSALRRRGLVLVVPGNPSTGATASIRLIVPWTCTITAVKSSCRVAVSSGTYTYDLNKNGTTMYSTQANRPTRVSTDGTGAKTHTQPDVTAIAAGDILDVDVDGTGSGISDFTLHVEVEVS